MAHLRTVYTLSHECPFDFKFDLVVSGINSGANLGDDVLYSGDGWGCIWGKIDETSSNCRGVFGGCKCTLLWTSAALCASGTMGTWLHCQRAACCHRVISLILTFPMLSRSKGTGVTYQGRRGKQSKPISSHVDPRGRQVYWIGLAGEAVTDPQSASSHIQSDFFAVSKWLCQHHPNPDGCDKLCGTGQST